MEYFAENSWKISDYLAYSPDLNPIENLWAIIKERLRKQTDSRENLEEQLLEILNNIDQETSKTILIYGK